MVVDRTQHSVVRHLKSDYSAYLLVLFVVVVVSGSHNVLVAIRMLDATHADVDSQRLKLPEPGLAMSTLDRE